MSTTDGMMVGVHSNHQEGDNDLNISINATITMQNGLSQVKKSKPLQQHTHSSCNVQPNYNHTSLKKVQIIH
jgi:predicted secreted protein